MSAICGHGKGTSPGQIERTAPMSTTTADYADRLNLAEQVARIERSQEETRKFVAEQHKLMAEAANLRVSRFVTPTAAVVAALGALTAAAPVLGRWLGVLARWFGGGG